MNDIHKREKGQYFTDYNPFNNKYFHMWFEKALIESNNVVLEPFAGSNNLIYMLREKYSFEYKSFDIEPKDKNVIKRDTIKNYPNGYKLAITNPPYLSKVSAKTKKIFYPETDFSDLYKLCLIEMIQKNLYVAAIVPINVIKDKAFRPRMEYFIPLTKKMFNTTETPVCLVIFSPPENFNETSVIINNKKFNLNLIEKWEENFFKNIKNIENEKIKFNHKDGNLFFRAIDNNHLDDIKFEIPSIENNVEIKVSSRHLTKIKVPFNVDKNSIEKLNLLINLYRKNTYDILLSSFMNIRSDNKFRRRMSFSIARKIIEKYITEEIDK